MSSPDLPNLSAKQMRAVQAVARYSSFIAAAADLRISQPGLSRIIRTVEDQLGIDLFHRSTRKVVLTSAGAAFLPMIDRILHDFEIATQTLTSLRDQKSGHVSLACPMSIANRPMTHIISDYRKRYPNVAIEIREALQGEVVSEVRSGAVDFGIAIAVAPEDDMMIDDLCDVSYRVIFRKDHRFRGQKQIALAELRDEPLISLPRSSNLRFVLDNAAAQAGFRLNHVITVNTYNTILELVRRGEGISVLNGVGVAFQADEVITSRPIDPPAVTPRLAIMQLRSRPMSPAANGLKQAAANYFRSTAG